MTLIQIKGDWNNIKSRLKQKWVTLTEEDLEYEEGQFNDMVGRIQERTGETRETIEREIREPQTACSCH